MFTEKGSLTMNIERHNQIIAKIEENPSCWNQAHWHCGTAHCYGGWAQILSGKKADIAIVCRNANQLGSNMMGFLQF